MNASAEQLTQFVWDILYKDGGASLDVAGLEPALQPLGKALQHVAATRSECSRFALELANGNLQVEPPDKANVMAAPLRKLHASLQHLAWQTKQVAKGDYRQHVDFMGEFSESFNMMIRQLETRQKALESELDRIREQSIALEQHNDLLMVLTNELAQWIVVLENESGRTLFFNQAAGEALKRYKSFETQLRQQLTQRNDAETRTREVELNIRGSETEEGLYLTAVSYPINWQGTAATVFVLTDVSDERSLVKKLEYAAYRDTLTQLYSRYYGMRLFHEWIQSGNPFLLCFIDLDNLKFVNDTFGHSEGDRYIIRAAELMAGYADDAVASRIGGDEFMLLVPDDDLAACEAKLHAMRETLLAETEISAVPYYASISYGVVFVAPDNALPPNTLLETADQRMYAFKRANNAARGQIVQPPDANRT